LDFAGKWKRNSDNCFNDKELLELEKNGIPDPLSLEKLAEITCFGCKW
jgi:hypothetical protein